MSEPPTRVRFERRFLWAPPLVAAGMLVLTVIAVAVVARDTTAKARERFQRAVQLTQTDIQNRMDTHVAILGGVAGLFTASEYVTREEFAAYVRQLDLPKRLPGALGIGWSERVAPADLEAFTARLAAESPDDTHVWPGGERDEYHAIRYLEPRDAANQHAIGFDMHTEHTRRAAMDRARDHARAAATARVTLVRDEGSETPEPGFLLYLPVYQGGEAPRAVADRRAKLAGFVYSPFRTSDLFRGLSHRGDAFALDLELYDGTVIAPDRLLYRSPSPHKPATSRPRFSKTVPVRASGRSWTLVASSQPAFEATVTSNAPALLLGSGLAVALLLFGFVRGQTEGRLRAERATLELQRSEEALREAGRAKDEFLATLSHELRTPLGNVLMWAQLLRTRRSDPDTTARAIETIERNARMLARLIDDLLDVSRIVSGKLSLSMRPTELGGVVRAAIEAMLPGADAKHLVVTFEDDGTPRWVSGDPARLQQVVGNLVSNAIKFTPDGGRITVRLDDVRGRARLTVSDTGCGIPSELVAQVFERFRQADSRSTRTHGGLGLGLAIVRHLVERHGGTVAAASAGQNRGTTVTVMLPMLGREAGAAAPTTRGTATTASTHPLAGLRVLVVDDEPDAREALEAVLTGGGASVTAVASAAEAFAALAREIPDVVLSDIAMPVEDGYGLIRRIRALPPERGGGVPAAALTAYATVEDRRRALQAGFQAHLPKPLDAARLVATVLALARQAPAPGLDAPMAR